MKKERKSKRIVVYVEGGLVQEIIADSDGIDDEAVADFFESQVDVGRKPSQFGRIWLHTHPGESPDPSIVDEETFERVFGNCDWALMFILARYGKTYARLRFNVGPRGSICVPVHIDYGVPFPASTEDAWLEEYTCNIHRAANLLTTDELRRCDWFDDFGLPSEAEIKDLFESEVKP